MAMESELTWPLPLGFLFHTTTWTHPHVTGAQVEAEPFKCPAVEHGEGVAPKPKARLELHSLGGVSSCLAFSL